MTAPAFRFRGWALLPPALAAGFVILLLLRLLSTSVGLQPDSPRYIAAGLNLAEYGILSAQAYRPDRPPQPGLIQGGPLTAAEIALAARLHPPTRAHLACLMARPETQCPGSAPALTLLYAGEILVFLLTLFAIARLVLGDTGRACYAVAAAALCKELWQYAGFILSEPLFLMLAGAFLLAWLAAWRQPEARPRWLLAGLALGCVMLVKPAWSALLWPLLALLAWQAWRHPAQRRPLLAALPLLAAGYAAVAGPLLARNILQFGLWSLSDPAYLVASLSHRLPFNLMPWRDWLLGWIYYQPFFGGRIVEALAGPAPVARLGWDAADSYYVYGRDILHHQLAALPVPAAMAQLVDRFILAMPLKNVAVTLLLAMRGLFVGGYWSAVLPLLLPALWLMHPDERRRWWLLLLPALAMVMINAQASVSLVRYNLALIPALAVGYAVILHAVQTRLAARFSRPAASA